MTVLFFLFFSAAIIAEEICIACEGISDAPESNILLTMDELAEEVTAFIYFENYTAYSEGLVDSPRMGISDSIVFIYVTDSLGNRELVRLYTDDEGYATFDFSDYAAVEGRITYGFKFIYCPFCHPGDPGYPCGFDECMGFAGIETNYTSPEDVPTAKGVSAPSPSSLSDETYLPSSRTITYIPPPPEATGATTPGFCLPLILIFALLGGAMLYTGRNPFAGFAISTPRMGRHIRYTPTGRGYSLDTKRIAMSVQSGVSEAKGIAAAKEKGMTTAQAVGAVSFQAEKGKGRKMVRDVLLNMITAGSYGSTKRTISRLKEGVASQQRMAATKEGAVGAGIGISGLSAKDARQKAKIQFAAAEKGMEKDAKGTMGKIVAGAFKNLGIGLLSSTFMGYAMSGVIETMLKNTDEKIINQAYVKAAALDVAEADRTKAQGGYEGDPPAAVIKIGTRKATLSRDGTAYVYESADGSKIELDKEAAENGVLKGKKTVITADGKTVTYHFTNETMEGAPKNADAPVAVTRVEVQSKTEKGSITQTYIITAEGLKHAATSEIIGTGDKAVTNNYAVQADGTQKLVQVTVGEGASALTYSLGTTEGPRGGVIQVWKDAAGQVLEKPPAEVATSLSGKPPQAVSVPEGKALTLAMLGADAPGNIAGQIGEFASVVVEGAHMKGVDGPIKMEWAVGAERDKNGNVVDYQYSQVATDAKGNPITTTYIVENGKYERGIQTETIGGEAVTTAITQKGKYFEGTDVKIGTKADIMNRYDDVADKQVAYAKALENVAAGQKDESLNKFLKETGLAENTSAYCNNVKEDATKIKVIGDDNKEHKIDSKAAVLLVNTGVPEGAAPEQIEQSIKASAKQGAAGEISTYGQNKVKETDLDKPGVQAGITAAAGTGTSIAGMDKSEYMAAVRAQLDMRTDLTTEQRAQAESTAANLWGTNGKALKNIAEGYENAAQQAIHAYPQYAKIEDKALEQHFGSLYEGKDAQLKNDIVQTVKTYGAGSLERLNDEMMSATMDNPAGASLADSAKEKTLANWAIYGLATPPSETPAVREAKPFYSKTYETIQAKEGETEEQYQKRIENAGLAPKEGETQEQYNSRIQQKVSEEATEHARKIEKQQKEEERRWEGHSAKYTEFTKSKNMEDALIAQSLILAADKKGELPDEIWELALKATTSMDMKDWQNAAKATAEFIKSKETAKQKKMAKELGELKI